MMSLLTTVESADLTCTLIRKRNLKIAGIAVASIITICLAYINYGFLSHILIRTL